jgi:HEAT repeat protein
VQPRAPRPLARLKPNPSMRSIRSFIPTLLVLALAGCVTSTGPGPQQAVQPSAKESAQLAILASSTDLHEKARACQELGVLASPAAVPALAALLNQEYLADYARSGLEGIRDPAAGEALRNALPKLEGRYLAGVVNSLGVRRDTAAIPELQKLALDPKRGVAAEAVASLGLIATPAAATALQQVLTAGPADLRLPAAHAALTAAELLAKEGNPAVARRLLDAVVRAVPSGTVATVARNQTAALSTRR